jgi:hypothetical protein
MQLPITERIWLRAFGTPPKFPFGELQIRLERYMKLHTKVRIKEGREKCRKIKE